MAARRAAPHPLVEQLRFTRGEWLRGLRGVKEEEALRRIQPMNSIGWIVGHLAWQEQRYWLTRARGEMPLPELNRTVRSGGPATTPALSEMLAAWRAVTAAVDPWLDGLTTEALLDGLPGTPPRSIGDSLRRVTYH
ncbi:MAG: DinB family protein [Candidatus Limnocylindria bacterium]